MGASSNESKHVLQYEFHLHLVHKPRLTAHEPMKFMLAFFGMLIA